MVSWMGIYFKNISFNMITISLYRFMIKGIWFRFLAHFVIIKLNFSSSISYCSKMLLTWCINKFWKQWRWAITVAIDFCSAYDTNFVVSGCLKSLSKKKENYCHPKVLHDCYSPVYSGLYCSLSPYITIDISRILWG